MIMLATDAILLHSIAWFSPISEIVVERLLRLRVKIQNSIQKADELTRAQIITHIRKASEQKYVIKLWSHAELTAQ